MRIQSLRAVRLTATLLAASACGGMSPDGGGFGGAGSGGDPSTSNGGGSSGSGSPGSSASHDSTGSSGARASSSDSRSSSGGASTPAAGTGSSSGAVTTGATGATGSGTSTSRTASSASSSSSTASGSPAVCNFASGLNVAWVQFANDVPNPDVPTFQTIFKNTHAAGGRVARWWFHTNGTVTPGYDASGKALKLQQSHIDGIKSILSAANAAGVAVNISLWSFDMLQSNAGSAHTNNQALIENDANRQAYIDNYLTPLVEAVKGTPGLYSWEIFNEPEGMGPNGWATFRTTEAFIQRTVNWLASAIHTADPAALVTNGAVTFDYCSGAAGKNNFYSDSALRAAGGKQNGTLDYYEVHYYTSNGASNSCFTHPASFWKLDKKLVMGEFAAQTTDGVAQNDLYTNLFTNGYDGSWAWSYDADWPWPAMQVPMQNLFNAHPDVGSCP